MIDECNNSSIFEVGSDGTSIDKSTLFHQRMINIREKGLHTLYIKGMVEGILYFSMVFDLYKYCIYGKHNYVSFPSDTTRSKGVLNLIHSDIFGSVPIPSLGKSWYYVSFIDYFLMYVWIYFLKRKYGVLDKF